jgi:hypothetical protein
MIVAIKNQSSMMTVFEIFSKQWIKIETGELVRMISYLYADDILVAKRDQLLILQWLNKDWLLQGDYLNNLMLRRMDS